MKSQRERERERQINESHRVDTKFGDISCCLVNRIFLFVQEHDPDVCLLLGISPWHPQCSLCLCGAHFSWLITTETESSQRSQGRNRWLLKEIIRPACEAGGQSASPRRWPCRAGGRNQ